ncbi:MAG: hypothetical protein FWD75_00490 [Propionibacteriaceae bacterium]|nr:hypothetical protein [Propionibacteriaceae bacterium]
MSATTAWTTPGASAQRLSLAHLATFTRFTVRRNWLRLVVWILIIVGMLAFIFDYYKTLFVDPKALQGFIDTVHSPSLLAMVGIISNPESIAGATWCKYWMFGSLMLSIGILFLMTRNLRGDEDQGRAELMRSTPLGIHSRLGASVIVMSALSVLIGVLSALVLSSFFTDASTVGALASVSTVAQASQGAWVFGMSFAAMGLLGVGVGALVNELCPSSGSANGIGIGIFAVFYLIRMIGDLNSSALGWVSPMGWAQKMDPWGANRWWPLLAVVVLAVVLVVVAWVIQSRRDLGDSVVMRGHVPTPPAAEPTPGTYAATAPKAAASTSRAASASPILTTVWGMGIRLQRGAFLGWGIGLIIFPLVLGTVIKSIRDLLTDTQIGTLATTVDGVLGELFIPLLALAVGVFAAQSATTLRTDEAHGVLESQLATGVGRVSWALQRLAVTLVGTIVMLLLCGVCLGASYGSYANDMSKLPVILGSFLVYIPACCVLASIFVLGFGWWPRFAVTVTWIVVGALWVFLIIGIALKIPQWVLDIMPFNATPAVPAVPMTWTPLIVLTLVAAVFTVAGLIGFRRRNVPM